MTISSVKAIKKLNLDKISIPSIRLGWKIHHAWMFLTWNLPHGIKNIFRFWRVVFSFWGGDFHSTLKLLKRGLEFQKKRTLERSPELEESRDLWLADLDETIKAIDRYSKDNYVDELGGYSFDTKWEFKKLDGKDEDGVPLYELVDDRTGEQKKSDHKIILKAQELQQEDWNKIFDTMKASMQNWWY